MSIQSSNIFKGANCDAKWSNAKKGCIAGILVFIGGELYLQKKYPAEGIIYKPGEKIIDELGRKKIFIGYTGHHKSTQLSKNRLVFFDVGKSTAQIYAKKQGAEGAVFTIFGKETPKAEDLERLHYYVPNGRCATMNTLYTALTPDGMQRLEVEFGPPEAVTYKTDTVSLLAPWMRCYEDIKTKCW